MTEIAVLIPARGGSKTIPKKNVKLLAGIPLIAYSIRAGLEAPCVERVIVSTDDANIASISRQWGAEVPFIRPSEFADDDTPDLPVFQHALQWLRDNENYIPDIIVHLRPTSPIRPPGCVEQAVTILKEHPDADCVRGVVESGQNPYKMWKIQSDGSIGSLLSSEFEEPYNMPRQKLPVTYWQTGHIDVIRYETIMNHFSMTGRKILPCIMDISYAIDIDTESDWQQAEWMLKRLRMPYVSPIKKNSTIPADIKLLVLDFDGVMTDNRVWVDENGKEQVACNRGDGMGISLLKKKDIHVLVLSTESNPVVSQRCRKLNVECIQGIAGEKAEALLSVLKNRGLTEEQILFVGNDINDLECMRMAGVGIAVADAHPGVLSGADLVLSSKGGQGAIRELCDMILGRGACNEKRD